MTTCDGLDQRVLAALRKICRNDRVSLHEPILVGNEVNYLKDCISSTYVSSIGTYVSKFEADLAEITGSKYVVAVSSGTAALHLALVINGVARMDEVIIPTLTFAATANAVYYCGAVPHLVDSDPKNFGIDPVALREWLVANSEIIGGNCFNKTTKRRIKALVPMHVFGHPAELDQLVALARDFRLTIIEDAAEALGSEYHGRHVGTFGDAGIISFNGNKIITTGGGGAILTNDDELFQKARHLSTTSKISHDWRFHHDCIGYNYRMPNINAAIGCAQLEELSNFLDSKRKLHNRYAEVFDSVEGVSLVVEPEGCKSNFWLNALILERDIVEERDRVLATTNLDGVMTRPVWDLMHTLPYNSECPRSPLPVAESLYRRLINIPSSANLV